jgi:hypothetical protein
MYRIIKFREKNFFSFILLLSLWQLFEMRTGKKKSLFANELRNSQISIFFAKLMRYISLHTLFGQIFT